MQKLQISLREDGLGATTAQQIAHELTLLGFEVLSVGAAAITLRGAPGPLNALMRMAAAAGVLAPELKASLPESADEAIDMGAATLKAIEKVLPAVESIDQPPRHQLH